MEGSLYNRLKKYLQHQYISPNLSPTERKKLIQQSKTIEIKDGILYKKENRHSKKLVRIARESEVEPILFLTYTHPLGGHFNAQKMFEKIQETYSWLQQLENIENYVRNCDQCQRRGKNKWKGPLHPIPVASPFYQIGIDIVGPLPITPRNYHYIVIATDYMTKWPEARAIEAANAQTVADFIFNSIICRHRCPEKILSDRGRHFLNHLVDEFWRSSKFNI